MTASWSARSTCAQRWNCCVRYGATAIDGALYFDTFPDASGLDPVAECEANIATVRRLLAVADRLDADNRLGDALARQDAVASQRIVNEALLGA